VETRNESAQLVECAVAEFKAAGVEATGEVCLSNCFAVADHIAERAAESGADVIVVGSRQRSRWGGLRGKGITERTAEMTALPVVTAPPPLRVGRKRSVAPERLVVAHPAARP
jgi:nucleotide-binding universal stress UspA family protein